jgi:hypothetical protein
MGSFQVYIDGTVERTPDAVHRVAEAVASKLGISSQDLVVRLAKGRTLVKSNLERPAADALARALEQLGARVSIESGPGAGAARGGGADKPLQSGLSAAFSGRDAASSLGALDAGSGSLSLSSLDGGEPTEPNAGSFGPPGHGGLSASIGPAPKLPPPPKTAKTARPKPKDEPLDLFAPPEAQGESFNLDLALDEPARPAKPAAPEPMPATKSSAAAGRSSAANQSSPVAHRPRAHSEPAAMVVRSSETPRGRVIAGVVLAIVVGFVPAHIVASIRETSAYAEIDRAVQAQQIQADSPELHRALDGYRRTQLDNKHSKRTMIALMAMAIWAVAGGAIAYVWFRLIPWDRSAR